MKLRYIILMLFLIIVFIGAVAFLFVPVALPIDDTSPEEPFLSVLKMGRAGEHGYAVFSFEGTGNVTLVGHDSKPSRTVKIIADDEGIETGRFDEFASLVTRELTTYGYTVEVTEKKVLGDDVYIVATGALPSYVLSDIQHNVSTGIVVYLGSTDLLIREGIVREDWYNSLSEEQKNRIFVYDTTLDSYVEEEGTSITNDILENGWSKTGSRTHLLSGKGITTRSVRIGSARYLRVIYDIGDKRGIVDSVELSPDPMTLTPSPNSVYPWQKSDLMITLNKTNGTAFLSIEKDGGAMREEKLGRVVEENVFPQKFLFEEPGDYIITVYDNSGTIASGLLHVKNFTIALEESRGYDYFFSVLVDDEPLSGAEATVSIGDSDIKRDFFVSEGTLVVRADLQDGVNTFNFEMLGTTLHHDVFYSPSGIVDVYLKYGIPGLLLILIVYIGARFSRKSVYTIRFSEYARDARPEMRISSDQLVAAFRRIRKDMNIRKSPINTDEFSVALKRYITNGAEITAGNLDELLASLEKKGVIEGHLGYYQLSGEGDIRSNSIMRMIREKLIENGVKFKEKKGKFVTRDYELGLFGSRFSGKAYVVVSDRSEIRSIMNSLDENRKAEIMLKQSNGILTFVPIRKLGEYL